VRLKSRWGCQNQPLARIATSLEGLEGVVGMSGHILLSMFEANRELVFPIWLIGTKAFEKSNCVKNMTRVSVFDVMATSYFRGRWSLLLESYRYLCDQFLLHRNHLVIVAHAASCESLASCRLVFHDVALCPKRTIVPIMTAFVS